MVENVFDYVKEINEQGVTILMVVQNARRALTISDCGIGLDLGRVRLKDTGRGPSEQRRGSPELPGFVNLRRTVTTVRWGPLPGPKALYVPSE
jgi:hypothetical protein